MKKMINILQRIGMHLRKKYIKLNSPELVTIADCYLAYQMGYETQVSNGHVVGFKKKKRYKSAP